MANDSGYLPNSTAAPSFDLSPDQQAVLDQADKFARKELYPLAERMDAEEWWPGVRWCMDHFSMVCR